MQSTSDIPQLQRRLKQAENRVRREQPKLLQIVANTLKRLATVAFTTLARGGQAIGITWAALSPAYKRRKQKQGFDERIGIRTGLMRRSNFVEIQGVRQVSLEYEIRDGIRNYAIDFDKRRTLLPEEAPDEWVKEIEPQAEEWLNNIIEEELNLVDFSRGLI